MLHQGRYPGRAAGEAAPLAPWHSTASSAAERPRAGELRLAGYSSRCRLVRLQGSLGLETKWHRNSASPLGARSMGCAASTPQEQLDPWSAANSGERERPRASRLPCSWLAGGRPSLQDIPCDQQRWVPPYKAAVRAACERRPRRPPASGGRQAAGRAWPAVRPSAAPLLARSALPLQAIPSS